MTDAPRQSTGRIPPHDLEAEESLLGAMLLSRDACEAAEWKGVRGRDFYKPAHAQVFAAAMGLYLDGKAVDPITVGAELRARANGSKPVDRATLARIQASTPASANAGHYARIVIEAGAKRALFSQLGDSAELVFDPSLSAAEVFDRTMAAIRDAELPPQGGPPSADIEEFLAVEDDPVPFIIPGTLRRRERLYIVAEPGAGKTTMMRQMAVQLSQGVHPWQPGGIAPVNVLLVDCENEDAGARDEIRPLVARAREFIDYTPSRLRVEFRYAGIDLLRRADAMWLMERIAANKPDVVMLGPLYKLHNVNYKEGREAKQVLDVLDRIRRRYDVALITETHPPKECWSNRGTKRVPLHVGGAGEWSQWPEFIAGLEPEGEGQGKGKSAFFVHVRPPRYRGRDWPGRLYRDGRRWPWETRQQHDDNALPGVNEQEPF